MPLFLIVLFVSGGVALLFHWNKIIDVRNVRKMKYKLYNFFIIIANKSVLYAADAL